MLENANGNPLWLHRLMKLTTILSVAVGILMYGEASAQNRDDPIFPLRKGSSVYEIGATGGIRPVDLGVRLEQPSVGRLLTGGLVGAATGVALGFAIGPSIIETGCERGEVCSGASWVQNGAFGGVFLFTTILTPYGVHHANQRQGSYWWDLLGSFTAGSVAMALVFAAGDPGLVALIPAQLAASYIIERATSR